MTQQQYPGPHHVVLFAVIRPCGLHSDVIQLQSGAVSDHK